jgi:hypothetical protein
VAQFCLNTDQIAAAHQEENSAAKQLIVAANALRNPAFGRHG